MNDRCRNPNSVGYRNYGGRGISICERWNYFANFLADMGDRPPGASLDRIDSDGNYEPGNCRWATSSEQSNNTRTVRRYEFRSELLTATEIVARTGNKLPRSTVKRRLDAGWPAEVAATTAQHRLQKVQN